MTIHNRGKAVPVIAPRNQKGRKRKQKCLEIFHIEERGRAKKESSLRAGPVGGVKIGNLKNTSEDKRGVEGSKGKRRLATDDTKNPAQKN